jgi:hypothetical protein
MSEEMKTEAVNAEELAQKEEVQELVAEYNLLLNKLIGACAGTKPQVAIAASISAAASICVEAIEDCQQAKDYFARCVSDAHGKFDEAYKQKAMANGADTGSEGEDADQKVVN